MSWETQHKSRNPADGIIRPFTACNDILFSSKRNGHTVSDTRSRTRGLGHTVSDTRSRTHGVGHTVSDWIVILQNKGNPPCGRTPTVLQPPHHLICTSTEGGPRGGTSSLCSRYHERLAGEASPSQHPFTFVPWCVNVLLKKRAKTLGNGYVSHV